MKFDYILIGSSPLLLIEAIYQAQRNKIVCIVDRDPNLGGSWSYNTSLACISYENACHLIEPIPDIYKTLEYFSDCTFLPLYPQPIRYHSIGFTFNYSHRIFVFISGIRLILMWFYLFFRRLFQGLDEDSYVNFKIKSIYFISSQLPFLFRPTPFLVKAPSGGYAHFVNSLIKKANSLGVVFRTDSILNASFDYTVGYWFVNTSSGTQLTARNITCTSSTNLEIDSNSSLKAAPLKRRSRFTVLIKIPRDSIVTLHSYVSTTFDDLVYRISRLDFPHHTSCFYFLVELKSSKSESYVYVYLKTYLCSIGILLHDTDFTIVSMQSFSYFSGSSQLPYIYSLPSFKILRSFGNLSCGIFSWLQDL